ncbi:MAG: hypothetical protein WBH47_09900 [Streptosporangiaceae bacterium]
MAHDDDPVQQFAAARQAAAAALAEWAQRVTAATAEALSKLDPAVRAAVDAGLSALAGDWRHCGCPCGAAHPDDRDVCDGKAVMTRHLGDGDVRLCAPCAVAQGVAEMGR